MKTNQYSGRYTGNTKRKGNSAKRKQSRLIFFLSLAAILLALLVGFMLLYAFPANDFEALSEQVQAAAQTVSAPMESLPSAHPSPVAASETAASVPAASTAATEPTEKMMLPQYGDLYQQNPDLYGWVRIEDTVIDYPVMRSESDPEKYLHANFEGEYSYPGTPFADAKCTNDSDNILIYAHNMLDGSMFRSLLKYESKTYWEAHPTIMYSDLYNEYTYEVVAAFYDRVYRKTETDVFKFYQFIDAEDERHYTDAIDNFKSKALYETNVDAVYGDQLITLITCAYHTDNGRFVVVARKASE